MRTIVKKMLEAPFTDAKTHMVGQNSGLGELYHFTHTIWSIVANRSRRFLCLRFVGRARAEEDIKKTAAVVMGGGFDTVSD